MKFAFNASFLLVLAAFAAAVAPQKQVVVSYSEDTPQSVIDQAMEAIKKAVCVYNYNIVFSQGPKFSP